MEEGIVSQESGLQHLINICALNLIKKTIILYAYYNTYRRSQMEWGARRSHHQDDQLLDTLILEYKTLEEWGKLAKQNKNIYGLSKTLLQEGISNRAGDADTYLTNAA